MVRSQSLCNGSGRTVVETPRARSCAVRVGVRQNGNAFDLLILGAVAILGAVHGVRDLEDGLDHVEEHAEVGLAVEARPQRARHKSLFPQKAHHAAELGNDGLTWAMMG